MTGAALTLAGCTEVPIARTNCWSSVGQTVTVSSKGTNPVIGTEAADATPCR